MNNKNFSFSEELGPRRGSRQLICTAGSRTGAKDDAELSHPNWEDDNL